MGCSVCQGHAHQVCNAPGCHDENEDLRREEAMRPSQQWRRLDNVPLCSMCLRPAFWRHDNGQFRCDTCPRF